MSKPLLVLLVLIAPAMGGCLDWVPEEIRGPLEDVVGALTPSKGDVFATSYESGWNHDGHFMARVEYKDPLSIGLSIHRLDDASSLLEEESVVESATLDEATGIWTNSIDWRIPDGEWVLKLFVDGSLRKEWNPLRIDGTPPEVTGLRTVAHAENGEFTIGLNAVWEEGATVAVYNPDGALVSTTLPYTVRNLPDGLHPYTVVFTDQAGNERLRTVQVLAGDAVELPAGKHTAGIVARYTNSVRVWDISSPGAYLSRVEASEKQPSYLGSGQPNAGITPDDPAVRAVVDNVVTSDMNTMEAALALYRWLYDELEYTEERLEESNLLSPAETFSNGGGVCRDLAAAYVSLLRAADVPARLVTGYLAGQVDGFHAWVEFYAGSVNGRPAWVPVDVSPIDGRWNDDANNDGTPDGQGTLFQSFGIRLPNYLPLRALPASAEQAGWATAISVHWVNHRPEFEYQKTVTVEGDVAGVLCVNTQTSARLATQKCEGDYDVFYGGGSQRFLLQSTQIIDYGIVVRSAEDGTRINLDLALPFAEEIAPVAVSMLSYSNHSNPDGSAARFTGESGGKDHIALLF